MEVAMKSLVRVAVLIGFTVTILFHTSSKAQSLSNYTFAATSGTFTALTGATNPPFSSESIGTDEGGFNAIPLGFDFFYMGTRYATLSASTNGWVVLGRANLLLGSTAEFGFNNNLSSDTRRPIIAPLWDDLDIVSVSNFSYVTSGSTPNRVFTAQWLNVKWSLDAASAGISFQVKLYETSGKIEFIYRQEAGGVHSSGGGASIGTTGTGTGSGNFLSLNGTGASPSGSTSTETSNLLTKPATGQVYTFTPPQNPTAPSTLTFTNTSSSSTTLNWTDNSSNETGFAIYKSTDASTYAYDTKASANATSITRTGLSSRTTYYWKVYAVTEGALSSALSGNKRTGYGLVAIGPTGNFPSLTAALTDIGVNDMNEGPAILELQSTYLGSVETLPVTIDGQSSISGLSATNTLTIRPASGATGLSISGVGTILWLIGASYVTVDGRPGGVGPTSQLTLSNTSTTGSTISLINDATHNTMEFLTVRGISPTSSAVVELSSALTSTGNSNNVLSDCLIKNGASRPGIGIELSDIANKANSILRCSVENFDGHGIYLNSATGTLIDSCSIYQLAPGTGISIAVASGISVFDAPGTILRSNKIYNLSIDPTSPVYGIHYFGSSGASVDVTLINNFISLDASATNNPAEIHGITFSGYSTNTLTAYYNTVYIGGSNVSSGVSECMERTTNAGFITLKNNIFINARSNGAGSGSHYAIVFSSSTFANLDYNLYYASGTGGVLGNYSGDRTTLPSWKTGVGQDAHSSSKALTFASTSTNDLHLSGGSLGDGSLIGTPIAGITTDIDNNTRSVSFPYMGADENTGTTLPVELISFAATAHTGIVEISWSTATENNNYGFEVERATMNNQQLAISNWEKIGFVEGAGTSNSPKTYSFMDNKCGGGSYSYRLKQIDRNGKIEYSKHVQVEIAVPQQLSLSQNYPNPFNPSTSIGFTLPQNGHASLKIYNAIGQEVATLFDGEAEAGKFHQIRFDAWQLPSGLYFSRLQFGGSSMTKKMMLLK